MNTDPQDDRTQNGRVIQEYPDAMIGDPTGYICSDLEAGKEAALNGARHPRIRLAWDLSHMLSYSGLCLRTVWVDENHI